MPALEFVYHHWFLTSFFLYTISGGVYYYAALIGTAVVQTIQRYNGERGP